MKYNFNIDAINDKQNSLFKSKYNSITLKKLIEFNESIVDLGLPSGTLWRKYNLGVDLNLLAKAEDYYGDYYAWGEIEPKPKNIRKTSWKKYKFFKKFDYRNRPIFTKYVSTCKHAHGYDITYADDLTQLLPEDDAAYQFDNRFQIPSINLLEELTDYLESEWVNNYNDIKGLNGTIFKSENGNEIFFPYAGMITDTKKEFVGNTACMLSNEIPALNLQPICMEMFGNLFGVRNEIVNNSIYRYEAFSIRPVLIEK